MKAIYLVQKGDPKKAFEIRDVESPKPAKGEVLIKSEGFGLNYAEVMARNGLYNDAPPIPCVLGYEVVGEITTVGDEVDKNWVGKRVAGFTRFGGYAEYAVADVKGITPIDEMDLGAALGLITQGVTAYFMAYEQVNIFPNQKVMIHAGAGGVGSLLIQLCKLKGAEVFANAGSDEKLKFMASLGADHTINYRKEDYAKIIRKIPSSGKIDVSFNPIGGKSFKKDLKLIGPGGTVVLFGGSALSEGKFGFLSKLSFVWSMGLILPVALMMQSKSIVGANLLKIGDDKIDTLNRCLNGIFDLTKSGKIKPQIGATYDFNEIGEAHALMESRKSMGKIIVKWGGGD